MSTCEYCIASKIIRKPFWKGIKTEISLQLIYYDICGLMSVKWKHDALYFITFIDNFTHYGHVFWFLIS